MRKVLRFLGEVRVELGKVVWPTRAKAARLTVVVVIVSVVFGAFLAAVDYGLGKGVQFAIDSAQKGKKSGSNTNPNTQTVPVGGAGAQPAPVPAGGAPGAAQPPAAQPGQPNAAAPANANPAPANQPPANPAPGQ